MEEDNSTGKENMATKYPFAKINQVPADNNVRVLGHTLWIHV
jgi:hypothetical protein